MRTVLVAVALHHTQVLLTVSRSTPACTRCVMAVWRSVWRTTFYIKSRSLHAAPHCWLKRLDLLPVNLDAGFLTHEVKQDPDAGVASHLLHGGYEICKWA